MILDLSVRYAATASLPNGGGARRVSLPGRVAVPLREPSPTEMPVALRWRDPGGAWNWTRAEGRSHYAPVPHPPGRSNAVAAAAALVSAASDSAAQAPPASDIERDLATFGDSRLHACEAAIAALASELAVVGGILHRRCQEPLIVEDGAGGPARVSLAPVRDWTLVHPATRAGTLAGRLAQEVVVESPDAFEVDGDHVLRRIVRKAMILARSSGLASVPPLCQRATDALAREDVAGAVAAARASMAMIASAATVSAGMRGFAASTVAVLEARA